MKKNAHQLLFIGSLKVLRIKPQRKNLTKTVGFLVGLCKTIKLVFFRSACIVHDGDDVYRRR